MISQKTWSDTNKTAARNDTILYAYSKTFGKSKIPKNEQYWTLAGSVKDLHHMVNPDCEALQLTHSGLVKPNQFYGVDISESTIENNRTLLPDYHWETGRLSEVIRKTENFNPAIINLDHHKMPDRALPDLFSLISILNGVKKSNILLVFNVLMRNPYDGSEYSEYKLNDQLINNHRFQKFMEKWSFFDGGAYHYEGTGKGRKKFLSFIWAKTT